MEGIKHGSIKGAGPSPEVASKLLNETSEGRKKRFARMK